MSGPGLFRMSIFGMGSRDREHWFLHEKLTSIERGVGDARSDLATLTTKLEGLAGQQGRHENWLARIDNDMSVIKEIPNRVTTLATDVAALDAKVNALDTWKTTEQSKWAGFRNLFAIFGALIPIGAALWTIGKYIGQLP